VRVVAHRPVLGQPEVRQLRLVILLGDKTHQQLRFTIWGFLGPNYYV
jgi:hypothetical protein